MISSKIFAGLALMAGLVAPAAAQQSEVLFQHKHWKVELVGWDDGTIGCVASVEAPGEIFSIWTFADQSVQLQFYSTQWQFNSGETADLQVQVDKRPLWNLTNANLNQNSVLFTLPDSDDGVDFIMEVAKGNRLYLRTGDGSPVQDYSLSGSRASIEALVECGSTVTQQNPGNPFN
ncbi:MAG: hypothetical protein IAE87_05690 [Rhodobacteraceae bacterium]|jgi:hypothetical protein|nr:hypothetical protein [Paracoccaceae bacterium]